MLATLDTLATKARPPPAPRPVALPERCDAPRWDEAGVAIVLH